MKMTRYFFLSNDLDDLEHLEEELESAGVVTPQIHLLTNDDRSADEHHRLHQVTSFMKKDVIHSGLIGLALGACVAILVLGVAWSVGWTESAAGWVPFIFLAIVGLGFCTWEGGLIGLQTPNVQFKHFKKALDEGKHVFFVDIEPRQAKVLEDVVRQHPRLASAGTAAGAPSWVVFGQDRITRFFTRTFP